jgi:hypothetical protein
VVVLLPLLGLVVVLLAGAAVDVVVEVVDN